MASCTVPAASVSCPLCPDSRHLKLDIKEYLKHIRLFHANQANFKITCGINGCQRSYTNLGTFQNHVSGIHNSIFSNLTNSTITEEIVADSENESFDAICDDNNSDCTSNSTTKNTCNDDKDDAEELEDILPHELLQNSSALFLLGIKEKYKLTQVATQGIVEGVTNLTQQLISVLKSKVIISMHVATCTMYIVYMCITFHACELLIRIYLGLYNIEQSRNCAITSGRINGLFQ